MPIRQALAALLLALALPAAWAQDGLRVPTRPGPGIDPAFAPGWLSSRHERFGFGQYQWRETTGFAPSSRLQWSYALGERASLGMSYSAARDYDPVAGYAPERQYGLIGRYSLAPLWSLSAEAVGREPGSMLRFNDLRIGLRRQF